MWNRFRLPRISLHLKLVLASLAVTLMAALLTAGFSLDVVCLNVRPSFFTRPAWFLYLALLVGGTLLVGLALGAGISYLFTRRLHAIIDVSRKWLRGNLSVRIPESSDDLGLLAKQLNVLAEHLEQDERDLQELLENNDRLADQVRTLAVIEERNRLARELHDSVKQHLFSLGMTAGAIRAHFDALEAKEARDVAEMGEMVREIEGTAQSAQQEMARLIEDLRPGSLQSQGLGAALNDYALLFGAREHFFIHVDVQGHDGLLPPDVSEALYRVAQEALHNVAHHSQATRVDIRLVSIPEHVTLTIQDNGVGFHVDKVSAGPGHGLGLDNMQERMLPVGGRVTIKSERGCGTTVVAEVGLAAARDRRAEIGRFDERWSGPSIENWSWLGQRLVIPVGQTWPWLPADYIHLRHPLVDADEEPRLIKQGSGLLDLMVAYVLQIDGRHLAIRRRAGLWDEGGYEWRSEGSSWSLRGVHPHSDRMVLLRNGQPLAAMQMQGRLLNTWTEIIYAGRGYRLSADKEKLDLFLLTDDAEDDILFIVDSPSPTIELYRTVSLPLLMMAALRAVNEAEAAAL